MLIKSKSISGLPFGWPVIAILLSFFAIAASKGEPVIAEQIYHGGSRHSDPFTHFVENTIRNIVNTGVDQVKSIVSGVKKAVVAVGNTVQGTAEGLAGTIAYATGNKDLGDKLTRKARDSFSDAGSSFKDVAKDAVDLCASGGNLYNKTSAELDKAVPHLGTAVNIAVSLTPAAPYVAAAKGFADVKNAYENGGMDAALTAGAFAGLDVGGGVLGRVGKGIKVAKVAAAAEKGAETLPSLAKLSALTKATTGEARVGATLVNNAPRATKYLTYLDTANTYVRPKDFIPDRDRAQDGKLVGSGGSNWQDRADKVKALRDENIQKQLAKDKAARDLAEKQRAEQEAQDRAAQQLRANQHAKVAQDARDLAAEELRRYKEAEDKLNAAVQAQRAKAAADALKAQQAYDKAQQGWRAAYEKQQADLANAQLAAAKVREANKKAEEEFRAAQEKRQRELAQAQADGIKAQEAEEMRRNKQAEADWLAAQKKQQADLAKANEAATRAEETKKKAEEERRLAEQKRKEDLKAQEAEEMRRNKEAEEEFRIAQEKEKRDQEAKDQVQADADASTQQQQDEKQQGTHTEDEEVQAQADYLKTVAPEKAQPGQGEDQAADAADAPEKQQEEQSKDEDPNE